MKRSVILLLISLLTTIAISSQNIYPKILNDSLVVITAEQLKEANLIFLEHSYLANENILLQNKLDLKDDLIFNYQKMDSINRENIIKLSRELDISNKKVVKLEKRVKNDKAIFWAGGGAIVAAIIAIFVK